MIAGWSKLPPEFKRAAKVLCSQISFLNNLPPSHPPPNGFWKTSNSVFYVYRNIRNQDIPSSNGWRWNQVKNRYQVTDKYSGKIIQITKLIPRKTPGSSIKCCPKYKLWRGVTECYENTTTIYWLEKGEDKSQKVVIPEENEPLNISDFEFLAPFMEPEDVMFFWGVPKYQKIDSISEWDQLCSLLLH